MKATKCGNQYQITYRCPNYPKLINEYFDCEEEANLRIAQIQLEKKRGTLLPPSHLVDPDRDHALVRETMTIQQLMHEYVTLYGLNHWSEGTLSCNQHRIDDYIIPYIGDWRIKAITTHKLEQFYRELQTKPAVKMKGREHENNLVSFSVVQKVHAILRSAFNQAIRWDYLRGANPAMAVELPRHKAQRREAWTDAEASYAISVCDDPILKLCMYLALGCSMRIGEILGLTWDCIHIEPELVQSDEAYLSVNKELRRATKKSMEALREQGRDDIFFTFPEWKKTNCTTSLVLKSPKTESSVRNIFIPEAVADALEANRQKQEMMKSDLGPEYQDYNIVIAQPNGRPFEEHQICQKFKALITEHNLKPVVFHSLRHSSTSMKLKISGGDIKAVQGDTGHAQANMVTDVYSHIMNDDRKRLARKMNDQFFSPLHTEAKEKAADKPPMTESMEQLIQLLNRSPELADHLLQMSQLLSSK